MYYRTADDQVVGVLNDFDLAITSSESRELATERTGTVPFMAYDLLIGMGSRSRILHIYGLSSPFTASDKC